MVRAVQIHHMNVAIHDLEGARGFYGGVLGLAELRRPDIQPPGLWYGLGTNELHLSIQPGLAGGRTALSLQPSERGGRLGGHVAFTLSGSLEEIARHLTAAAIPFARGRAGLPQIFCEDPSGNLVELNTGWTQEPLARPAAAP